MGGLSSNIPIVQNIDSSKSILSNLLLLQENQHNTVQYLDNISENIVELIGTAVIDSIKDYVVSRLDELKIKINYRFTRDIDNPEIKGAYNYKIVDDKTIEVSKNSVPDWDTSNLLISVHSATTGMVFYPIILKLTGKFIIKFSDPMSENGVIVFI